MNKMKRTHPRAVEDVSKKLQKIGRVPPKCNEVEEEESSEQEKEHHYQFNIRDESHIWVDGKLIKRPTHVAVSYGILIYKKEEDDGGNTEYNYLLGLIPQGNAWTVFKGMPEEDGNETPEQTAMREFQEETSIPFPYPNLSSSSGCNNDHNKKIKATTLFGLTSNKKKLLEIYLVRAPETFSSSGFDKEKVVKIDSGYMQGKPEIIDIQFMTKQEAVEGFATAGRKKTVKIYKSQIGILEHAEVFLQGQDRL